MLLSAQTRGRTLELEDLYPDLLDYFAIQHNFHIIATYFDTATRDNVQTFSSLLAARSADRCSIRHAENLTIDERLALQFKRLKVQTHTPRHLFHHIFEGVQAKRRTKYSNARLETYLFEFEVDTNSQPYLFSWMTDHSEPTKEELVKFDVPHSEFSEI